MSESTEESLSVEQAQVKIAEYQAIKATAEAEREKEAAERRRHEAEIRESNTAETFRLSIGKTGIKFHMEPSELRTVLGVAGFTLTPSNTGDSIRVLDADGEQIALETALEKIAVAKPYLVHSGADHLRPRDENGTFAQLSKEDFGNNLAAKSRWISEHGIEAWTALPAKRTPRVQESELTAALYSRLPLSEKSKLASELGEAGISAILRRR